TSDGVVKDYDILSVQQIQFADEKSAAPSTATPKAGTSAPGPDPRLVPGSERVTRPAASNAANTGYTIPTGSKVLIRMIDRINSETNKFDDTFKAVPAEPLYQGGVQVIPTDAADT